MGDNNDKDKKIEIWKMKKLIKSLEGTKGNKFSMISLIIPPRDQISRVSKMLADEYERANRKSVLGAIASAQQGLKLYSKVPPNGLVLYTGTIVNEEGKEEKVTIDFEPFRPIKASVFICDNKFHTEALNEMLELHQKFGYIVIDPNCTLFGTLRGNTREVLHKLSVYLPKKNKSGEPSALRLARLSMVKRDNYVRKISQVATKYFINPSTSQPNVAGLIIARSPYLNQSDLFDQRLMDKILDVVYVSYGREAGFNEAINLSSEILANRKYIEENRLIEKFIEEIRHETGRYVCGVDYTLKALELGAVETLIVSENLDIKRYVMKKSLTGETVVKHLTKEQQGNVRKLDVVEKMSLVDWLAYEYTGFGCTLEIVTNESEQGARFFRGFGGLGGILRHKLDLGAFDDENGSK